MHYDSTYGSYSPIQVTNLYAGIFYSIEQEAQLMLTTGSTRL